MKFILDNLSENQAKEICSWKYEGIYSVYNLPLWEIIVTKNWSITDGIKRLNEYAAVLNEFGDLCGYIRLIEKMDSIKVGLGLKPVLCGQGMGKDLMNLLIYECNKRYGNKNIMLEVRTTNQRAIKCYKDAGFKIINSHRIKTLQGYDEFVMMEYSNTK